MEQIDTIFTDLDGPILDGKLRHYECYRNIILESNGIPLSIDEYWKLKRAKVKRDEVLALSYYPDSYNTFFQKWLDRIEQPEYLELDVLKPDAKAVLERWSKAYTLYLVTLRQSEQNLLSQLNRLQIRSYFNQIICCDYQKHYAKYEAIKHFSCQRAVFIGDTEEDMNTADKCNIPFIAITNGLREKAYLNARYYFEEIKEIDL